MCGHVGVIGSILGNHEKTFKQLLILDSLRGEHSTGVAAIARFADPLVSKVVGDPFVLFDNATFNKSLQRQNMALIGHNRYATQGAVNKNNAHPFVFDGLIGAHNGTLTNKGAFEDGNNFAVDSQALFNHIDKHGLQDALNKSNGAWALVWWDLEAKRINFVRNKERTLYYAFTEDGKAMFWASEDWMLTVACYRNNLKIEKPRIFLEDTHYSMSIPGVNADLPAFDRKEAKSSFVPFIPHQHPVTQVQGGGKAEKSKVVTLPTTKTIANVKGLTYKVTGRGVDKGIHYVTCSHPDVSVGIRMYVDKPKDCEPLISKLIVADCGPLFTNSTGTFFKLSLMSHHLLEQKKPEFVDKRGTPISEKEWNRRYSSCCWCSGPVLPTSDFKFASFSDLSVCEVCAEDPEVLSYLN